MDREQALSNLNELWLTCEFSRILEKHTFTDKHLHEVALAEYRGYRKALFDSNLVSFAESVQIEKQRLDLQPLDI